MYGTVTVIWVTLAIVLWFLQKASVRSGNRWRVPVIAAIVAFLLVASVRVKTLSGELVPQFEWRFASHKIPDLQNIPELPNAPTPTIDSVVATDETENDENPRMHQKRSSRGGNSSATNEPRPAGAILRNTSVKRRHRNAVGHRYRWRMVIVRHRHVPPTGTGIAITLEQRDKKECVNAYDLLTGELKWLVGHETSHYQVLGGGGPRSTPTIDGDMVYAQGATGMLWCLDLLTGEQHWRINLLDIAGWIRRLRKCNHVGTQRIAATRR